MFQLNQERRIERVSFAVLFLFLSLVLHAQRTDISPLLRTQWGQGSPYNLLCPTIAGKHCQTGCVATAMAQVMNFHQWPKEGFDWGNMLNLYDCEATEKEKLAVAQLMAACGEAVNMEYGVTTSAAWEGDAAVALREIFCYAPSVREVFRNMYGRTAWENLIYHELAQHRPVFYGGMPSGFAHQFVCDGYQEGKFHFNMAWQFLSDGYYHVDELDRYPEGQTAIIGIQPIGNEDFGKEFSVDALTYTVTDEGEVSVRMNKENPPVGKLVIPVSVEWCGKTYSVTAIDYAAFEDCTSLTALHIPATVTIVGNRMVLGCTQLATIELDTANPWYAVQNDVLFGKDELIAYPISKSDATYRLPDGITAIPASFFRGNTYLQRIELPASVQTIDILAFRNCTALTTIVSENSSPHAIEELTFDDETYANATLIVPAGTANQYKRLGGWKLFQHIEEATPTNIQAPFSFLPSPSFIPLFPSSSTYTIFLDTQTNKKYLFF